MHPQGFTGSGMFVPPEPESPKTRCFITKVEVEKPDFNRLVSRVHFKGDHAHGNGFEGSIHVVNGQDFRVGDVINVTIEIEGQR